MDKKEVEEVLKSFVIAVIIAMLRLPIQIRVCAMNAQANMLQISHDNPQDSLAERR